MKIIPTLIMLVSIMLCIDKLFFQVVILNKIIQLFKKLLCSWKTETLIIASTFKCLLSLNFTRGAQNGSDLQDVVKSLFLGNTKMLLLF